MTLTLLSAMADGRIRPDLLANISDEVSLVEKELHLQVCSQVDLVHRVSRHTLLSGGKRLRPAFVSLAAKATGLSFDPARSRRLGACLEMIHMATLIHDDVLDNSGTRRGRPTAGAEFGNYASIMSGDVLLAKAMLMLAIDGDLRVIRCVSEAVVDMAEGEVQEMSVRGDFDLDQKIYLGILRRKTAGFIQACCEVGAIVSEAPDSVQTALGLYGLHTGIAFQIVDDILDYSGDRKQTGKPIGTDFREGQATLPLIFLRESLSDAEATIARRKFGGEVSEDEIRMIVDWMETRGALTHAEELAREHVDLALDCLTDVPDTPARDLLVTVAHYVIQRKF